MLLAVCTPINVYAAEKLAHKARLIESWVMTIATCLLAAASATPALTTVASQAGNTAVQVTSASAAGATSSSATTSTSPSPSPKFKLPSLSDLLKLPNKTVTPPKLFNLPKINFTFNTKPFVFPKIKLDLSIPELPTSIKFNLTMPTIDATTVESLPTMLESILVQLKAELQKAGDELGIDISEDTETTSTADVASTSAAQAVGSAGDAITGIVSNVQAWMKAAAALSSARKLLGVDVQSEDDAYSEQLDNAYVSADDLNSQLTRSLLAVNSTVKTDLQSVSSRVSLLSSDAFAISYTAFKVAKSALSLLTAYLKASATGTIDIDELSLLDFAANTAALGGELSDMLSRIAKTNADAVSPLKLTFKIADLINILRNRT